MEDNNEEISVILKNFYEASEKMVKTEAIINRVYTDKISEETITEKVNAQMNAINIGIQEINPKFNEKAKNYDVTKKAIDETMNNYRQVLIELSKFYDGKIEQLILRKVELEASLTGAIISEEYLKELSKTKIKQKDSDKVRDIIKGGIKKALDKITKKKKNNTQIDTRMLKTLQDEKDIADEMSDNIKEKIQQTENENKLNKEKIEKIEREINLIKDEIQRINDRKKIALFDAMEVGNKTISTNIKKPKMFKKITKFFASRFNTSKVIFSTIIEPLNKRIENFKNSELADMKG